MNDIQERVETIEKNLSNGCFLVVPNLLGKQFIEILNEKGVTEYKIESTEKGNFVFWFDISLILIFRSKANEIATELEKLILKGT